MSIYLVDYENYKNLVGISVLSENDRVVIFYSIKANTLSFESHKDILNSKARIEYKLVEVGGQNALDFQLSSYLGSLIGVDVDSNNKYYIVSKDKGFGYVATFWKNERNLDIEIIRDLSKAARRMFNKESVKRQRNSQRFETVFVKINR